MPNISLGFIGGGNMTSSLVQGLLKSGYPPQYIFISDPNADKRELLKKQFSINTFEDNAELAEKVDVLVIAVKPKVVNLIAEQIQKVVQHKHPLIISVASGITTPHLHRLFGADASIVRAMPNMGSLLQVGATGLFANGKVSEEQKSLAESILRSVGVVVWLNHEHDIDTVTALSGSGPAYFFYIMDALEQNAGALGLKKDIARILTLQTALGAARMAMESEINLHQLIEQVSTKGGITEKALAVLEQGDLRKLLLKAMETAKKSSEDLSEDFKNEML